MAAARGDRSPAARANVARGMPLVLASGSPQRRQLLSRLGVPFTVRVPGASELEQGEDAAALAVENALRKARAAVVPGSSERLLGCDTIVVLDGVIYGKPRDARAAGETLAALAGRTHEVISGVALLLVQAGAEREARTAVARTRVTFAELDERWLRRHIDAEEWRGRSGGYAIQGAAGELALQIDGELENVVGLPLRPLVELCPELFEAGRAPAGA
jgi:septum formation protein